MVSISITDRYRFKRNNNPEEGAGREGKEGVEGGGRVVEVAKKKKGIWGKQINL